MERKTKPPVSEIPGLRMQRNVCRERKISFQLVLTAWKAIFLPGLRMQRNGCRERKISFQLVLAAWKAIFLPGESEVFLRLWLKITITFIRSRALSGSGHRGLSFGQQAL